MTGSLSMHSLNPSDPQDRSWHALWSAADQGHVRPIPRPGQRVKLSVLTPVAWLALGALIGGVAAVSLRQEPGGAEVEDLSSRPPIGNPASAAERDSPGIGEGALGLGVGSRVYGLGHPDLGTGTVVGVNGLLARVWFESGEWTLPRAEIRRAEPVHPDEPRAEPGAGGSPG